RPAHLDRMLGASDHPVANVRGKGNLLVDFGINGDEGRVGHADADLFDRSYQKVIVTLTLEDRSEQPDHLGPPDGRSVIEPAAVSPDLHIKVATEWRIPQMHRRRALCRGAAGCRGDSGRIAHSIVSLFLHSLWTLSHLPLCCPRTETRRCHGR